MSRTTIVLYMAVNESGDWEVSSEGITDAVDSLTANSGAEAIRAFTVSVGVTLPQIDEVHVEVPDVAEAAPTAEVG